MTAVALVAAARTLAADLAPLRFGPPVTMFTITSRFGTLPSKTHARVMLEIKLSVFHAPVTL